MKLIINKKTLLEGLQSVQKAVSNKSSLPIISGILLQTVSEDKIRVTATDLEMSIETVIEANVKKAGSIVLPAKYFVDIIRKLEEGLLTINADEEKCTAEINSGSFAMVIHGFNGKEFPSVPQLNDEFTLEIAQVILKKMIEQTIFAASHDESRPFLTGVLFHLTDYLALVATDGHRLALKKYFFSSPQMQKINAIIPAKAVYEIARLLKDDPDLLVKIKMDYKQVSFELNDVCLITRLIEGQFPHYDQIIPDKYQTQIIFNKTELSRALERASLIVRGESNIVKLIFADQKIVISSNTPEVGNSSEEVACSLEGEDIQIAFNFKYMLDVLKTMETEEICMRLGGALSPGVIKELGEESYTYVIMPVRSH